MSKAADAMGLRDLLNRVVALADAYSEQLDEVLAGAPLGHAPPTDEEFAQAFEMRVADSKPVPLAFLADPESVPPESEIVAVEDGTLRMRTVNVSGVVEEVAVAGTWAVLSPFVAMLGYARGGKEVLERYEKVRALR